MRFPDTIGVEPIPWKDQGDGHILLKPANGVGFPLYLETRNPFSETNRTRASQGGSRKQERIVAGPKGYERGIYFGV